MTNKIVLCDNCNSYPGIIQVMRLGAVAGRFCHRTTCTTAMAMRTRAVMQEMVAAGELCNYHIMWHGSCGKEAVTNGKCQEHAAQVCSWKECGAPAVRTCDHAMSLVCGAPVCDKPEHYGCPAHPVKNEEETKQVAEVRL